MYAVPLPLILTPLMGDVEAMIVLLYGLLMACLINPGAFLERERVAENKETEKKEARERE